MSYTRHLKNKEVCRTMIELFSYLLGFFHFCFFQLFIECIACKLQYSFAFSFVKTLTLPWIPKLRSLVCLIKCFTDYEESLLLKNSQNERTDSFSLFYLGNSLSQAPRRLPHYLWWDAFDFDVAVFFAAPLWGHYQIE